MSTRKSSTEIILLACMVQSRKYLVFFCSTFGILRLRLLPTPPVNLNNSFSVLLPNSQDTNNMTHKSLSHFFWTGYMRTSIELLRSRMSRNRTGREEEMWSLWNSQEKVGRVICREMIA